MVIYSRINLVSKIDEHTHTHTHTHRHTKRLTDSQRYYLHRRVRGSLSCRIVFRKKIGIIYCAHDTQVSKQVQGWLDRLLAHGYSLQWEIK